MAKGEEAFSRKPSDQPQLTQMVLLSGIPITEYFAHLLTQWKVAIKHITLGFKKPKALMVYFYAEFKNDRSFSQV